LLTTLTFNIFLTIYISQKKICWSLRESLSEDIWTETKYLRAIKQPLELPMYN